MCDKALVICGTYSIELLSLLVTLSSSLSMLVYWLLLLLTYLVTVLKAMIRVTKLTGMIKVAS